MNRIIGIMILVTGSLILYLFLSFDFWACPIKLLLNLNCPACGMTRAFRSLLHLNIIESFKYNLLGLPLFIIIGYFLVILLYSIFKNSNLFLEKVNYLLARYYKIIIIVLLVNMIINNIKKV